MKRLYFLLLLLATSYGGFAMVIESGSTIVIDQPVHEDLYLAGGTVTINAPVYGDLVVAGGTIFINDTVARDILVAGGRVTINGYVGGKIRCLGGTVKIGGDVQGDVVIAGATMVLYKGSTVSGSLLSTGGDLTLNGTIQGDITAAAGQFKLYGVAGRNIDCRGGKIEIDGKVAGTAILAASDWLMIDQNASFHGPIRYWTPDKTTSFGQSFSNGQAVRDESLAIKERPWYLFGAATIIGVLWYLGMGLVMIILLQYLLAPILQKAGDTVYSNPLRSLGTGFLFIAGMPLLITLLFFTFVGIPIALILLFIYITALLFCSSFIALVAAHRLSGRSSNDKAFWPRIWAAFGMLILLRIIISTPFLGWGLFFLLACIAYGSVLLNLRRTRRPHAAVQTMDIGVHGD